MQTLQTKLKSTLETADALRRTQVDRQETRSKRVQHAAVHSKHQQEFHKQLQIAAFEYQQRKLAVQSLQARIQREIQYLVATAEDLAKRVGSGCGPMGGGFTEGALV